MTKKMTIISKKIAPYFLLETTPNKGILILSISVENTVYAIYILFHIYTLP